jgi:hypothetical protein
MNANKVELAEGEKILFEADAAVLTNRRLVSYWKRADKDARGPQEALLKDIASFKKINGGQESHLKLGLIAFAIGAILTIIEVLVPSLGQMADSILFLAGSLGIVGGLYFILRSVVRVKPNTTVFFQVPGAKDVPVTFPGRDNPKADELTRHFQRAKRGIGV